MRATQGDSGNCSRRGVKENLHRQALWLCLVHLWETCGLNHHQLYPISRKLDRVLSRSSLHYAMAPQAFHLRALQHVFEVNMLYIAS